MTDLLREWRTMLASRLRKFRSIYGRWPTKEIIAASKRGIEDAVAKGFHPPRIH